MSSSVVIKFDRRALGRLGVQATEGMLLKAGQYLRTKVVENISTPTSLHGPSRPGQFPHADTGRLRQSIFVKTAPGPTILGQPSSEIRIGTNLRYGLHHEYQSGRSFLRKTLYQELRTLRRYFRGATVSRG